jgi:phage gpG-like protein
MAGKVQVTGKSQVEVKLNKIAAGIKKPQVPLKRIGIKILNLVNKNFQQEGQEGDKWKALSPATIARKGSSRILVDTGNLRASYTYQLRGNSAVQIGSPVFYSIWHEEGTKDIPQRPVLPKKNTTLRIAKQEVQRYLVEISK